MISVPEIVSTLRGKRMPLHNEKALQDYIFSLLSKFDTVVKEHHLDGQNIIDFWVDGRIGIEVKIHSGKRFLYNQCERYLGFDDIQELLLITNMSMGFPEQINGKDCYVFKLGASWL